MEKIYTEQHAEPGVDGDVVGTGALECGNVAPRQHASSAEVAGVRVQRPAAALAALKGGGIAIVGYGSQGRAQALNLRDSGFDVVVGARAGGGGERKAKADGFRVVSPAEAAKEASLVALLTPDMSHRSVYARDIAPNLKPGSTLLVAHGFSVHYGEIVPRKDIDVVLVAPKGPGDLVRREYEIGRGVPCLFALQQDASGSARENARPICSASRRCFAAA